MNKLFSLLLCLSLSIAIQGQNRLAEQLDNLIANRLETGSDVGILAVDLQSGDTLYRYRADKLSRPASTMKLVTTITTLARPEGFEPFRTEVWSRGEVRGDTLVGDLYVVGGMDPEFDDAALDTLVSRLAGLPFRTVSGRLYGDVSLRDSVYWGAGWSWDDTPYYYQPYLSPLMLHKGVVEVEAMPTAPGDSALLRCTPASSYYTLCNATRSRTPSAGRFSVSRNWLENGNDVVVQGNVTARSTGTVNIFGSAEFFLHTLQERLEAKGFQWSEPYALAELPRDGAEQLVALYETPIQQVVDQLMKESDNLNAEAMLTRLGAISSGHRHLSAEEGLTAIREQIKALGHDSDRYRVADGCGLSNYNALSPELLVSYLRFAYSRTDLFRSLYKSLPVAGVDGTLEYRMTKGTPGYQNVHAKTGTISGISCLAGYLRRADGHLVAFAIMNQNVRSSRAARQLQDAVCEALIKEVVSNN